MPSDFYQPIIAQDLRDRHPRDVPGATASAMPTPRSLAIERAWTPWSWSARLQRSDLDDATLNAVRVMADTLVLGVRVQASR